MQDEEISERIKKLVRNDFHNIDILRSWVKQRLIEPRPIYITYPPDTKTWRVWLVTDHLETPDFRIIYDPLSCDFGLILPSDKCIGVADNLSDLVNGGI